METVKVFYDVIISLNEYGLLPDEINVKEAQRLVTGHQRYPTVAHIIEWLHNRNPFIIKILQQFYDKNYKSDEENFNCLIIGKGDKNTYLFRANKYPGLPLGFLFLNGYIIFGYYNEWENEYYPGKGWVYTRGFKWC